MAVVAVTHFADRLADAVERKRSQLVVGIDPVLAQLPDELQTHEPAEAYRRFSFGLVDAVAEHAVAVKPQSAFFEALGTEGVRVFREVCDYARDCGLLVIADVKRGDIGSTARAYAEAFIPLADAVTVNPYLGRDSLEPFLDACRREGAGIFCLVKTSNPGSSMCRTLRSPTAGRSGSTSPGSWASWAKSSWASADCRRSAPSSARPSRSRSPQRARSCRGRRFCCPASARRAAKPAELAAAFAAGPGSGLVSASRSVIYASRGADWRDAAAAEAARLAGEARDAAAA